MKLAVAKNVFQPIPCRPLQKSFFVIKSALHKAGLSLQYKDSMTIMIKAGVFLLIICAAAAHPFHISITDIEYDKESRSLEIAQKIFTDDLETALKNEFGQTVDLNDENQREKHRTMIEQYLRKHLDLNVNGKQQEFEFLGMEREEDATWCYIEVGNVRKLKSLQVSNRLLLESFDDQMNLVHIKKDGKIRSMRLSAEKTEDLLIYE